MEKEVRFKEMKYLKCYILCDKKYCLPFFEYLCCGLKSVYWQCILYVQDLKFEETRCAGLRKPVI